MLSQTGSSKDALRSPDIDGTQATQLSTGRIVLLALAPGALTVGLSLLASSHFEAAGFPPLLAMLLAAVCGASVFPLAIMLREARRVSGGYSILSVIPFRARIPWPRFVLWAVCLLVWGMVVFAALTPISNALRHSLFKWMPSSFTVPIVASRVSPAALFITGAVALLSPLVINPIEELFFRGYLLPRMAWLGRSAPYLNTALWALGHLWQPWGAPVFFLAMLPAVVVVQRTRCVWFAVVGHTLGNFLMILGMMLTGAK